MDEFKNGIAQAPEKAQDELDIKKLLYVFMRQRWVVLSLLCFLCL